jgi:hypothetical protein
MEASEGQVSTSKEQYATFYPKMCLVSFVFVSIATDLIVLVASIMGALYFADRTQMSMFFLIPIGMGCLILGIIDKEQMTDALRLTFTGKRKSVWLDKIMRFADPLYLLCFILSMAACLMQ